MKLGLIADIHGNLQALTTVLQVLRAEAVDLILCAGDLVGYGADPNCVIKLLQAAHIPCVAGNYDEAVAWDLPKASRKPSSPRNEPLKQAALDWTKAQITYKSRKYLMTLPFWLHYRLDGLEVQLIHAGPDETDDWYAPDSPERMDELVRRMPADVIILSHTHQQFIYEASSPTHGSTLIINPGAIGRSLDRDVRAAYALFDTATHEVTQRRVEYDLQAAVGTIRQSSMPNEIANLVENGARRIEELDL